MWSGVETLTEFEVLLLVEQHAPVLVDLQVGEAFLECRQVLPVRIHLGHGDELQVLALRQRIDVGAGHAVGAEAGVQDRLAGRGVGVLPPDERRGESGSTGFQDGTAGHARHERGSWQGVRQDKVRVREGEARSQQRFRTGWAGSPLPARGAAEPLICFLMASPRSDCFTTFAMRSMSAGS